MQSISREQSGAFVESFSLEPTADGPLAGLQFAVKDIIDVRGHHTGCGNPSWRKSHPPAVHSAVCVEQLLASGACCVGKTVTDEVAFGLLGENHFYGTPLNNAAPDRVPGGSSSGSASAVACGLADFALGSDTGGSVRIPASNCGLYGMRPTHGRVSLAGVMPFAPSFDTIGMLAREADVFARAARVLLAAGEASSAGPGTIHLVSEAFALADSDVRAALEAPLAVLNKLFPGRVRETSLGSLCGVPAAADLNLWRETFSTLQWAEIQSSMSDWIATAQPEFGPRTAASFEMISHLDRTRVAAAAQRREQFALGLRRALGDGDMLCIPTAPAVAPRKGAVPDRRDPYYLHTLSLTAIAGLGRLPQVTLPLAAVSDVPIGLSLLMAPGEDARLLELAVRCARRWDADS